MTIIQTIRTMSENELGKWLSSYITCATCPCKDICTSPELQGLSCDIILAEWLKNPYMYDNSFDVDELNIMVRTTRNDK